MGRWRPRRTGPLSEGLKPVSAGFDSASRAIHPSTRELGRLIGVRLAHDRFARNLLGRLGDRYGRQLLRREGFVEWALHDDRPPLGPIAHGHDPKSLPAALVQLAAQGGPLLVGNTSGGSSRHLHRYDLILEHLD